MVIMGGEQSRYSVTSCVEHGRMGRRVTEVANFDFRDTIGGQDNLLKKMNPVGGGKKLPYCEKDWKTSEVDRSSFRRG